MSIHPEATLQDNDGSTSVPAERGQGSIRQQDAPFTWGSPLDMIEIGPYAFRSFHPWKRSGSIVQSGKPNRDRVEWHVYIDGKDTHTSYPSLDWAMVGAVADRHDGPDSSASHYFMRMIGATIGD